jgi:hypothetical protein
MELCSGCEIMWLMFRVQSARAVPLSSSDNCLSPGRIVVDSGTVVAVSVGDGVTSVPTGRPADRLLGIWQLASR